MAWEINLITKQPTWAKYSLTGLSLTLCSLMWNKPIQLLWLNPIIAIASVIIMCLILLEIKRKKVWFGESSILFVVRTALLYIATFPYIFIGFENKKFSLLMVVALAATDTGAYFIGKKIGRTPLTSLSPKKTIEGSLAGLISTIAMFFVLNHFFHILTISLKTTLILSIIVSVLAQLGDIHESLLKRLFNKKDSSNLLPGHGGIYDRIDSYIFSIPITVLLLHFWNAL